MLESIDIAEVSRRTGVSARALRFYEARGLLKPLRTASGRRHYGAAALSTLHHILALKRAGLTLAQIQRLLNGRSQNLAALIDAQLAHLETQAAEIERSRQLLLQTKSRVERSEPIDVATFCSLIEQGERQMNSKAQWDAVASHYLTDAERGDFAATLATLPDGFDQAAYAARWKALGDRIKAALPLDPASAAAQALLGEWSALLAPFNAVATPAMQAGVSRMYADMPAWEGQADPGFDAEVFRFIQAASRASASRA
ncbi:MerR family transcriptional regulator [Sphingomonas sp. TDK1]|uniref:MerR family transcriptional regulator n=1 Tax=Sphingomonas sp. TDK1 TaxID=453247 RepID=UPI0007D9ABEB|nr:MerR family transcriptional regulator [Sphingomonas sp. TDK1]OAN57258.1 MerR family transcriptional regulator [Sphingomonas sp. TDK1]